MLSEEDFQIQRNKRVENKMMKKNLPFKQQT